MLRRIYRNIPSPMLNIAEKIFDELARRNFCGMINLGENGEAALNPDFIGIIERLHKKMPNACFQLASNMNRIDKVLSIKILEAGLSELHFNIDGASSSTYEFVKGIPFDVMRRNVHDFLKAREELGSECKVCINIITAAQCALVLPGVRSDMPDDASQIISYWKPYLRQDDVIKELGLFRWSVRDEIKAPNTKGCALLYRVLSELFVAPNGDCYVCCVDDNARVTFGNLVNCSIAEVWTGKSRLEIVNHLFLKQFKALGEPCSICLY